MFGYRVPRPDEAMLVSGGKFGRNGAPFKVVTGHGSFVPPFVRKVNFLTLSMTEAEVSETCVTRQGISLNVRAVIAFKVGQRRGEHRQRRPAVPVRPGSDVDADRADLRRAPALDHRLDDRRGDRHRAAEARHRGAGRLQDGDGQDRPDRRLAADPVDRRQQHRLHRRDGGPAQRGHPAPGADRAGPGQPGGGRGAAAVAAGPGGVRPADRRRPGPVQGRGGQGAVRGGAGRPAGPGPGHDGRALGPGRAGPAPVRAAAAPAGRRGDPARRGRGREGPHPGRWPTPSGSPCRPRRRPRTTGWRWTGC